MPTGLIISPATAAALNTDALGNTLANQKAGGAYILDLITFRRLYFQMLPEELEMGGDSSFESIKTNGRNLPYYEYTGGEDIIRFTVHWYAKTQEAKEVLLSCKWLESLTKRDGGKGNVHPVQFVLGELFKLSKFLLTSAPYKLGLWHVDSHRHPRLATQELTLMRISDEEPNHKQIQELYR